MGYECWGLVSLLSCSVVKETVLMLAVSDFLSVQQHQLTHTGL